MPYLHTNYEENNLLQFYNEMYHNFKTTFYTNYKSAYNTSLEWTIYKDLYKLDLVTLLIYYNQTKMMEDYHKYGLNLTEEDLKKKYILETNKYIKT